MQKWLKKITKMHSNLLPIAKEGWNYIGYSFLATLIFIILDIEILSILSILLLMFFIFSFRNPERELPNFEPNSVLSPVDGKVISIDEIEGDSEYAYKLTLGSSYLDVAILRAPMSATVDSCMKIHGAKLSIDTKLAKSINENIRLVFEDSNKNKVQITHMLNQSFCGIKLDNMKAKSLLQSSRYGVMNAGLTYIFLPHNFRFNIKVSDKVEASQSLIGYFS